VESRVIVLETLVTTLQTNLTSLQTLVSTLQTKVTVLETAKTDLSKALSDEIAARKAADVALKSQIDLLTIFKVEQMAYNDRVTTPI